MQCTQIKPTIWSQSFDRAVREADDDDDGDDDDDDDDVDDDDDKLTLSVPAFAADRSKHLTFSSFLVDFCRP